MKDKPIRGLHALFPYTIYEMEGNFYSNDMMIVIKKFFEASIDNNILYECFEESFHEDKEKLITNTDEKLKSRN